MPFFEPQRRAAADIQNRFAHIPARNVFFCFALIGKRFHLFAQLSYAAQHLFFVAALGEDLKTLRFIGKLRPRAEPAAPRVFRCPFGNFHRIVVSAGIAQKLRKVRAYWQLSGTRPGPPPVRMMARSSCSASAV